MASRLILDTSLIIAAEREQFDIRSVIGNGDPAISVITATELLVGVGRASPAHCDLMAVHAEGLFAAMSIEPFTLNVARMHAILYAHTRKVGHTRGASDLMIAATAIAESCTLVGADSLFRDLQMLEPGLALQNWRAEPR